MNPVASQTATFWDDSRRRRRKPTSRRSLRANRSLRIESLESRLSERGGDEPDEIQRRLQKAREEVWSYRDYYYIVINDDFKQACKELESIITAERTKTKRLDMGWLEENFIREREKNRNKKPAEESA